MKTQKTLIYAVIVPLGMLSSLANVVSQEAPRPTAEDIYRASLRGVFQDWRTTLSNEPAGNHPPLPSCEMTFNVGFKDFVDAGQIKLTVVNDGENYKILGKGASIGAANKVFPYSGEVAGLVSVSELRPVTLEQRADRPKMKTSFTTEFEADTLKSRFVMESEGQEKKEGEFEFKVPGILDPFSAALYVRSQPLEEIGEQYSVLLFSKVSLYVLTLTVKEKGQREWQGEQVDVVEMGIQADRVQANGNVAPVAEKLKSASFLMTDDELRLPIEFRAELSPAGAVTGTLTEYKEL